MAVIRCQACGKPNPDFLDTCQFCDARLKPLTGGLSQPVAETGQAVIRCQACGKPNPDFIDTCQYCEARLKPLSAGEAQPAPTPRPPVEPEPAPEVVDWMSQLRNAQTVSAPDETGQAPKPTQAEPEWMWGGPTSEPPQAPSPPAHEAPPAGAELPDWLRPQPAERRPGTAPFRAVPSRPAAPERPLSDSGTAKEEPLPDWLRSMRGAPAAEPEPPPEELPDWLRSLRGTGPLEAAPPQAPTAEPAEEALPDWLRTMRGTGPLEAVPSQTPTAEPAAEEVPDWLRTKRGTGPLEAAPPQAPSAGPAAQEAPDWLSGLRGAEGMPAETTAPLAPRDKLDWLGSMSYSEEAAPTTPESEATPTAEEELPEWLRSARGTGLTGPLGAPASGAPAAPTDAWLGPLPAVPGAEHKEAAEPEMAPAAAEGMPDWLQALRGVAEQEEAAPGWQSTVGGMASKPPSRAEAPEPPSAPAHPPAAGELAQAALPVWLAAMRPLDIERPGEPEADVYEETVGVLAGMRGVLRAELAAALPHKTITRVHQIEASQTHAAHAALLTSMIGEEAQVRPVTRRRVRLAELIERWLVFLALGLAVVALPIFAPGLFPPPQTIGRDAKRAFDQIEGLPPAKPALVAFDYEPGQQGELNPAAEAMLAHLMLRRGVRVVGVSTRIAGAAVGQAVLSEVARQVSAQTNDSYTYGTDYLNLGYIPGGAVGLLQFAGQPRLLFRTDFTQSYTGTTTVWDAPLLSQVQTLGDFSLILLVTGTPEAARAWIEQTRAYAGSVPILAAVSAGAEPLVRPYLEAERPPLAGLVVGLMGAAQYEQQVGWKGDAAGRWNAVGGGLLAAVILMAGGNFVSGVLAWRRSRKP